MGLDGVERFLECDVLSAGMPDWAVQSIGGATVDGLTAELTRNNQYWTMASMRDRIEQDVFQRLLPDIGSRPSGSRLPFLLYALMCCRLKPLIGSNMGTLTKVECCHLELNPPKE